MNLESRALILCTSGDDQFRNDMSNRLRNLMQPIFHNENSLCTDPSQAKTEIEIAEAVIVSPDHHLYDNFAYETGFATAKRKPIFYVYGQKNNLPDFLAPSVLDIHDINDGCLKLIRPEIRKFVAGLLSDNIVLQMIHGISTEVRALVFEQYYDDGIAYKSESKEWSRISDAV